MRRVGGAVSEVANRGWEVKRWYRKLEGKSHWFEDTFPYHKLPEHRKWGLVRERNKHREFVVEADIGESSLYRLPFLRNASRDTETVLGDPPASTPAQDLNATPVQLRGHLSRVRPYDTRSTDNVNTVQSFVGSFLNSFIALDVEEWDMDALLNDIESPDPLQVLHYLTDLLEQRHLTKRFLNDTELAVLVRRCRTPAEALRVFDAALPSHHPECKTLTAVAKACRSAPEARKRMRMLQERGVLVDHEAYNAVLATHTQPDDLTEALRLYDTMKKGKLGFVPDRFAFNVLLRVCAAADTAEAAKEALAIWDDMQAAQVTPNIHTLLFLLRCSGNLGFDTAAAIVDSLCTGLCTVRLGNAPPRPVTKLVAPTHDVWATLLHLVAKWQGGDSGDEAFAMRVYWVLSMSRSLSPNIPIHVWRFPELAEVLQRLSPDFTGVLRSMAEMPGEGLGKGDAEAAEIFLKYCGEVNDPLHLLLAHGMWDGAAEFGARNTPSIYAAMMAVLGKARDREGVVAVYNDLAGSGIPIRPVHHELLQSV
eukprot:Sspe_Gene.52216::Locus_28933_Transcript_1_1_Confidence_1.000_Length_1661::g.52216::m.52216